MNWLAALLLGPCAGPVCNFDTLSPWAAKMETARIAAPGTPPVHILQIGDSHTAGDALTGGWRALLQAQVGSGGRGVLPPGRPYAGYLTRGVTVSMLPGWQVAATFGPGSSVPRPPLGLSSFTLTSTTPDARMGLVAEPAMAFDRFVLCAMAGMPARSVKVKSGDGVQDVDLLSDIVEPRCTTLRWETPQTAVEVIADAGPVMLTSWGTFRDKGGVTLSNVGIVGSQLLHFARTDDDVVARELRAYAPDLIVLAFGTNEGFGPRIDVEGYEAVLRAQIARLRALAPEVPILMLGPPDALSRNAALRSRDAIDCGDGLFAPAGLAQVRAVQRRVAGDLGIAWWDWQARMGGICSARRWVAGSRMRGDFVHFTSSGGADIALLLQQDLAQTAIQGR